MVTRAARLPVASKKIGLFAIEINYPNCAQDLRVRDSITRTYDPQLKQMTAF